MQATVEPIQVAPILSNPPPQQLPLMQGFVSPLMLASTSIKLPPKFSGRKSDWHDWKQKWVEWHMTLAQGNGWDDKLVFGHLLQVLDDGEAAHVRQLRNNDPNLSYEKWWKSFVAEQEKNDSATLRCALQNLRLEHRGKLTRSDCKKFTSNFLQKYEAIPNMSTEEAFAILTQSVSHDLAMKLQTRNNDRRKKKKFHVSGIPGVSVSAFQNFLLEQLGGTPKFMKKEGMEFIIDPLPEQCQKLQALDGQTIVGQGIMSVKETCDHMSIPEALEFLLSIVESWEELEDNRRSLGKPVHAVKGENKKEN
jgi:hypothetical protein